MAHPNDMRPDGTCRVCGDRLSRVIRKPQLRNKGRRRADFTNATAGEWRRLTSRCSRRGRITAFHGVKSLQPAPLLNFVLRALTTLACACTRIRVQYLDEEARVGASAAKPRMEAGSARGQARPPV